MADVLLRNGFIIDGTGKPGFTGDVAVQDGKIIAIAPRLTIQADQVIDAAGKVVIPGLIDPHVHEEYVCLLDGGMELFMRQGVTTCLSGNCGHAVFNVPMEKAVDYYWNNGLFSAQQSEKYKTLFPQWQDFAGYADYWEQQGCNMNMAVLQGHGTIRWYVMGGALDRKPTPEEKEKIDAILRTNMEQGAWGVSFGLSYVPSRYADTDELCDVVSVVKEYDGVAAAHLRHHIGMLACTQEFIDVGRRTGARIQISHLKSVNPECFDAVKEAADAGMPVCVDTIPVSTGHLTRKDRMLQFIMAVSDSLFTVGMEGVKAALHTPEGRKTVLKDAYMFPEDRNLTLIVCSEDPALENRSIADIAKERGQDADEVLLDLLGDDQQYTFYLGGPSRPDFPTARTRKALCKTRMSASVRMRLWAIPRIWAAGTSCSAAARSPSSGRCTAKRGCRWRRLSAETPVCWPTIWALPGAAGWRWATGRISPLSMRIISVIPRRKNWITISLTPCQPVWIPCW